MKVRPYRVGDIEFIARRPIDDYGEYALKGTKLACEQGNSFTIEHDGIPIAIIGLEKLWTGVAHVWTIVSDEARSHGIWLTKTIKEMLDSYCEANKIRRCEALVKSGIVENIKWLKLLGFQYESTRIEASPTGGNLDNYVRFYHG